MRCQPIRSEEYQELTEKEQVDLERLLKEEEDKRGSETGGIQVSELHCDLPLFFTVSCAGRGGIHGAPVTAASSA